MPLSPWASTVFKPALESDQHSVPTRRHSNKCHLAPSVPMSAASSPSRGRAGYPISFGLEQVILHDGPHGPKSQVMLQSGFPAELFNEVADAGHHRKPGEDLGEEKASESAEGCVGSVRSPVRADAGKSPCSIVLLVQ